MGNRKPVLLLARMGPSGRQTLCPECPTATIMNSKAEPGVPGPGNLLPLMSRLLWEEGRGVCGQSRPAPVRPHLPSSRLVSRAAPPGSAD